MNYDNLHITDETIMYNDKPLIFKFIVTSIHIKKNYIDITLSKKTKKNLRTLDKFLSDYLSDYVSFLHDNIIHMSPKGICEINKPFKSIIVNPVIKSDDEHQWLNFSVDRLEFDNSHFVVSFD